jgi:SAM-dependent methyltransferase
VVPYPGIVEMWREGVRQAWEPMTNAWWYAHERFNSSAKVVYVAAHEIDRYDIGDYDLSIMSNVLLHNRDPFKIMQNCARITRDALIVVDLWDATIEASGDPLLRFLPEPVYGTNWNQWWRFSTRFLANALAVMGFPRSQVNRFSPRWNGIPVESFRLTAMRDGNGGALR